MFSRRVGLIAGLLLAANGPFLFFSTQLFPAGLAVFLDVAAIALWVRCLERPHWDRWLLFGLTVGTATITVPNSAVLLIVAVVMAVATGIKTKSWRPPLVGCVMAVLGTAAPVLGVAYRNFQVTQDWVPLSTNAGIAFYVGNNPNADQTVAIRPGEHWYRLQHESFQGDEPISEAQHSAYFLRRSLAYILDDPLGFAAGPCN